MSPEISLPYSSETLRFQLPERNLAGVFLPASLPPCEDAVAEVRAALERPLDLPPLSALIRRGETVVILLDDHTRATPADLILPILLEQLHQAGVREQDITLLITHGSHRLSTDEEVRRKVGEAVYGHYRIFQHQCSDERNLVFLGLTSRATPVWVNRLAVEADRLLGVGHIGPSPYAGYSGGRKLIVPGVAGLDTINASHSHVVLGFRQFGRIDVPCRQDIEEAAAMVKMDMVINVVLSSQEGIVKAFAGTPEAVFQQGVAIARQLYEVDFPAPVDIAVTAGVPYDIDLYQAVRAVEYADAAVRPGGAILLVAACPEGVGGEDFYSLLADPTRKPEDFLRAVVRRSGMVTFSVLGYSLARIKAEKKLSILASGISPQELAAMGFQSFSSLQEGVDELLRFFGPQARLAVFPRGSATIPVLSH